MTNANVTETSELKTWIEPAITELSVSDTEVLPNLGRDGGRFVDCVRS